MSSHRLLLGLGGRGTGGGLRNSGDDWGVGEAGHGRRGRCARDAGGGVGPLSLGALASRLFSLALTVCPHRKRELASAYYEARSGWTVQAHFPLPVRIWNLTGRFSRARLSCSAWASVS